MVRIARCFEWQAAVTAGYGVPHRYITIGVKAIAAARAPKPSPFRLVVEAGKKKRDDHKPRRQVNKGERAEPNRRSAKALPEANQMLPMITPNFGVANCGRFCIALGHPKRLP